MMDPSEIDYAGRKVMYMAQNLTRWMILDLRDFVNLLGDNIDTTKKNRETSVEATKEVGVEVNAETTVCCCLVTRMHGKSMTYR
jgi:hypothetical protein